MQIKETERAYVNLCGSSVVKDGLDVESKVVEARFTDTGLALNTDTKPRLSTSLTKSNQKHQNVVISRADTCLLDTCGTVAILTPNSIGTS